MKLTYILFLSVIAYSGNAFSSNEHHEKCASYGYQYGTDSYANCVITREKEAAQKSPTRKIGKAFLLILKGAADANGKQAEIFGQQRNALTNSNSYSDNYDSNYNGRYGNSNNQTTCTTYEGGYGYSTTRCY